MTNENIKSCIILCGGKSSRMGQDKGSMIIQNNPMIKHVLSTLNHHISEVVIVLNDEFRINKYNEFINPDDYAYGWPESTLPAPNAGLAEGFDIEAPK